MVQHCPANTLWGPFIICCNSGKFGSIVVSKNHFRGKSLDRMCVCVGIWFSFVVKIIVKFCFGKFQSCVLGCLFSLIYCKIRFRNIHWHGSVFLCIGLYVIPLVNFASHKWMKLEYTHFELSNRFCNVCVVVDHGWYWLLSSGWFLFIY